jgi:hypothetical protein
MQSIATEIPNVEDLLALEPEELAAKLLEFLNQTAGTRRIGAPES